MQSGRATLEGRPLGGARRAGPRLARASLAVLAVALLCGDAPDAAAKGEPAAVAVDPRATLTGHDIYQRVLDNRFRTFVQEASLVSADRGGNAQESRFKMWFEDLSDPKQKQPKGTIVAKSLVEYTHPFDIRYSGYLVLSRLDAVNDQFVYLSSQRRVKRVNLRGEAVFGTDFSFEDILPRHIEDATYRRLADEDTGGIRCFVIRAVPKADSRSEYSKLEIYVDRDRYVPVLTRYWDDRGVEVKELRAEPSQIREFGGVWVPMRLTMRNLRLESYTTLQIQDLEPNPKLPRTTFELRRLEDGH